jgi:hypothetical protein
MDPRSKRWSATIAIEGGYFFAVVLERTMYALLLLRGTTIIFDSAMKC